MKYEYAVNHSDNEEFYRRAPKDQIFQYSYTVRANWRFNSRMWVDADDEKWDSWCIPDRVRPLPDSAILLAGLMDD